MTKTRDFKQVVRARMAKTGESYTAARAALLKQAPPRHASAASRSTTAPLSPVPAVAPAPAAPNVSPSDYARIAGMSDESLKARTGCGWEKWVHSLDNVNATAWPHREIARYVHETYKVPSWWAQTITVGYERVRGLRDRGQVRGGSYRVQKSRTFDAGVGALFRATREPRLRAKWIPGVKLVLRSATSGKVVRFTWSDGSSVEVRFTSKGRGRASLAIEHSGLAGKEEADLVRMSWSERLDRLGEMLATE